MVKTEEWTFDTLKECYCLNYTYGPIKTWAHSYSGKARKKHVFRKQETAPQHPGVPGTFLEQKWKTDFYDVILDEDTILDDDVMYIGQTTRDLIKI